MARPEGRKTAAPCTRAASQGGTTVGHQTTNARDAHRTPPSWRCCLRPHRCRLPHSRRWTAPRPRRPWACASGPSCSCRTWTARGPQPIACDALGEALQDLVEVAPLIGEGGDFELSRSGPLARLVYRPQRTVRTGERVEAVLASALNLARCATGGRFCAAGLWFARHRWRRCRRTPRCSVRQRTSKPRTTAMASTPRSGRCRWWAPVHSCATPAHADLAHAGRTRALEPSNEDGIAAGAAPKQPGSKAGTASSNARQLLRRSACRLGPDGRPRHAQCRAPRPRRGTRKPLNGRHRAEWPRTPARNGSASAPVHARRPCAHRRARIRRQ